MSFVGSAATVVARLFRLIKPNGSVVADFTANGPVGINNPALRFYHNSTHSSYLAWTNPDSEPGSHSVGLTTDPTGVTNAAITLGHDDATSSDTCVIQIGAVAAVQIDPLVTKLVGQSLEFETTFGVLVGGRSAYMLSEVKVNACTVNTAIGAGFTNITGMATTFPNSKAGDLIKVVTMLTVNRAVVSGFAFCQGTVTPVANCVAIGVGGTPMTSDVAGSFKGLTYETWFQATGPNAQVQSQAAGVIAAEFIVFAGYSSQVCELHITN